MLQHTGMAKEATKIIVTSGQNFTEDITTMEIRGRQRKIFDAELQKPYPFEELEKALIKITAR